MWKLGATWTVIMLLVLPRVLVAGQEPEMVDPGDPHELLLRVDVGKSTFVMYEPVILTYSLANLTDLSIRAETRVPHEYRYLKISIRPESGNPIRFDSGPVADVPGVPSLRLAAGVTMADDLTMFFNDATNELAFPRTGNYTILGRMYVGNSPEPVHIEAAPVSISVVEPGTADRQVIKSLGSEQDLVRLLRGGPYAYCKDSPDTDCPGKIKTLIREHPRSAYTPAIAFELANYYGWEKPGGTPQYKVEVEILQDFLDRWPEHPLAADVTSSLVYALERVGKEKEALDLCGQFEKKYPGRTSPRHQIEKSELKNPTLPPQIDSQGSLGRDLFSSSGAWKLYAQGSYESFVNRDRDPDTEQDPYLGITNRSLGKYSLVFAETIRD